MLCAPRHASRLLGLQTTWQTCDSPFSLLVFTTAPLSLFNHPSQDSINYEHNFYTSKMIFDASDVHAKRHISTLQRQWLHPSPELKSFEIALRAPMQ